MRTRFAAVLVGIVVAAACGNAGSGEDGEGAGDGTRPVGTGSQPGLSETEIRVGGVASVTNPLGNDVAAAFDGAVAYFEKVNEAGGVHGRTIRLVAERDDNSQASRNASHVRALVEQDEVFAVIPVAVLSFAGADYLAERRIPTFGWNIQAEWSAGPALFGQRGSFTCFDCATPVSPWMLQQAGFSRPGIVAYNVPQSRGCADGFRNSFAEFGPEIVFEDTSIPFGAVDLSADVRRMRSAGVDFVFTCMDANGAATVAKAIRDASLDIPLYLPNGYDHEFVRDNATVLEGSFVGVQFRPFELAEDHPVLEDFVERMDRAGKAPTELALYGWAVADLFVRGLEAAGPDLTRESLVRELNSLESWDAGGVMAPVDWTIAHEHVQPETCWLFLQVEGGELVPRFGEPDRPFLCFDQDAETLAEPTRR